MQRLRSAVRPAPARKYLQYYNCKKVNIKWSVTCPF